MKILAIETSCDETAAAVVENGKIVLSNVVASSQMMHAKTGGIIPENAAREQVKSIIPVIDEALERAKCKIEYTDALAVTTGPGLVGSLLVGVESTKSLSYIFNKPIIPVNHLLAHVYGCFIEQEVSNTKKHLQLPGFPLIAVVVSGGHTDIIYMKDHGIYEWIGGTRDDAAGEAFDKIARLLGLPYPGGPSIEEAAKIFLMKNPYFHLKLFPRPMMNENNFDFSFSGLKTAVQNELKKQESGKAKKIKRELLAAEVQEAICDVLVKKSVKAIAAYRPKSFLLCGGVAANTRLRELFGHALEKLSLLVSLHVPERQYCTDNAAMVGVCSYFNNKVIDYKKVAADPELGLTN